MFSAYDLQNNEYFESGRNKKRRKECEEEVINMLTLFRTLDDEDWNIPNKMILEVFEVRIDKHKGKMIDDCGNIEEETQRTLE